MKIRNIFIIFFELIIWYSIIYFWIYTIKYDVNLYLNSFVLLIMFIIAVLGLSLIDQELIKNSHNL